MPVIDEILDGRYRIKRQLGLGGMGTVYEAVDTKRFDKTVALKEIRIDVAKVPTQRQQELFKKAFEREAKILTQLDYEAFPQVVDYFTEEDRQYLVMELIQGDDLEMQLRTRNVPFSIDEVINFADQLLDALDYLHTLNPPIIHRDIKPQNLKLTHRGRIKLLDFGIAKGSDVQANFTITNQTFLAATLHYSPIEQILRVLDSSFLKALMPTYGEKITKNLNFTADASGDIYALGATVYHLITNVLPVDALKRALELWVGNADPLPDPDQLNSKIPTAVSEWILKSMEIDREMRFASAIEMRQALHLILEAEKLREEEAKKEEWLREQEWLKNQERLKEQEWLRKQEKLKAQERLEEQEKLRKEREQLEVERRNIEESRIANLKQLEEAKLLHLKQIEDSKKRAELENQRRQKIELEIKESENQETENRNIDNIPAESPIINPFVTKPNTTQNPIPAIEYQQIDNSPIQIPKPTSGLSYLKASNRVSSQNENKQQLNVSPDNKKAESEKFSKPTFDTSQIPDAIKLRKTIWLTAAASLIVLLIVFGILALRNESDTSVANLSNVSLPTPSGMVYIPGGEFMMGRDDSKNDAEKPAHKVSVESFFIDQTEVTNEKYAAFVKAAKYKPPTEWKNGTFTKGEEDLPVVGVTWEDANAYAKWAGKRLPTEEEWEFAAKGTNNFIYPWGNDWKDKNAKAFTKVGSFSEKSPFGLSDMVGNAWEWTASDFKPYPNGKLPDVFNGKTNLKTIRGGSFDSGKDYSTTTYRLGWAATGAENYKRTGFRCVKDIINNYENEYF